MHPRISVIIPARNEAANLPALLASLAPYPDVEVVVVDGESTDPTAELARDAGARVITCPPGRGRQMNAGARLASGNVLLFLHADTRLPSDFPNLIAAALRSNTVVAGAFRLAIDGAGRSYRIVESLTNWRAGVFRMPYGDQALFVRAEVFEKLIGFHDAPIMEDVVLVRRLRRLGTLALIETPVTTSARRWERGGVWRTTLVNQLCLVAWRLGVSLDAIARWREARGRAAITRRR